MTPFRYTLSSDGSSLIKHIKRVSDRVVVACTIVSCPIVFHFLVCLYAILSRSCSGAFESHFVGIARRTRGFRECLGGGGEDKRREIKTAHECPIGHSR